MSEINSSIRKFRYDINFLRAIAVSGVVLFHFNVPYFNGGFSGVDIFFVISGYLMTKIILDGLFNDGFSLLSFYEKRVSRIIPALLFSVLIITGISFLFYMPVDYDLVTKNAISSLLFYSNILYSKVGYFAPSSDENVFLHTWSLSVEWQFYLLLPLILMAFHRVLKYNRRYFLYLILIGTIISFALSIYFTKSKPDISFYFLFTRAWEMLFGGIAYLLDGKLKTRFNKVIALSGYVTLFLGFIFLNDKLDWPGFYTLIPVIATFLIVLARENNFRFPKSKYVQLLGKSSYSIYLWHWPVYVLLNYVGFKTGPQSTIVFMLLSVLLGWLSYKYIESYKFKLSRTILIPTALLAISLFIVNRKSLNRVMFKPESTYLAQYFKDHSKEIDRQMTIGCFVRPDLGQKMDLSKQDCYEVIPHKKNFVLIGDSHSAHLSKSFRDKFAGMGINLIQVSVTRSMPILNKNGFEGGSDMIINIYKNFIPKHSKDINGVLISANWINARNKATLAEDIKKTINYLQLYNIRSVVIGQNETYTTSFPSVAARSMELGVDLSDKFIDPASGKMNKMLKSSLGKNYIDIYGIIPIKVTNKNIPYMVDHNHFSQYGADYATNKIFKNKEFQMLLN